MPRDALPIDAILPQIVEALRQRSCLVITAPTGAGKTTRVPPAILASGVAGGGQIVMLEPRRLAARAAARRMAAEYGCRLGDEVGYQVRFDRQAGAKTRILVVTEGLLVRMLQDDPYLEKVGAVIFDEFHERSLDTDLALAMARRVQETVRPDLRIVVMSATLSAEGVSRYLGDCPIIVAEGRLHPVEIVYENRPARHAWSRAVAQAALKRLEQTPGDVLVFLPGLREIRQTTAHLEDNARRLDVHVVSLYGDLPAEEQDVALLQGDRRKIVLATNVAETSVTVEGITAVVDTGLARFLVFEPKTGLDRLELLPISRASADQRAGRAGRTQPGVCVRLWSEASHRLRPAQIEPEIRRVDLAGPILQLLSWGERGADIFPWLDSPPVDHVTQAQLVLRELGAMDDQGITELGKVLARLPLHPRLGCLLMDGSRWGYPEDAALAAALLSERDPFMRAADSPATKRHASVSDVLDRLEALKAFQSKKPFSSSLGMLNRGAAHFVLQAWNQYVRLVRGADFQSALAGWKPAPRAVSAEEADLRAILAAFPDRVARRREPGSRKGVMVGGRGIQMAPSCAVTEPELFVCVDVDDAGGEALVRQASTVERDWLPPEKLQVAIETFFDPETDKVSARKQTRYRDLVLQDTPAALPDSQTVAATLLEAARTYWERVAPTAESEAGQFRLRARCLRGWMPELNLPTFDDAELRELLPDLCPGRKSFSDLRAASWKTAMQNRLTSRQLQAIDREAPERLLVPSGSRLLLHYEVGRPPVLKLRIQEAFGWRETPRVGGGRVAVLLHLLAPSGRPEQVTDDLASFWANTYPRIRGPLRARYPKHAWPEDPATAQAERRPKRKT